ncbi:MAG: acyltransferase [Saprospiraceae bacterium]|nr:acyltransferase [Saprospiraceae bacterium]
MNLVSRINNLINKAQDGFIKLTSSKTEYWRKKGVKIGNMCSLGSTNFGGEPYLVTIGNHVQITDNVRFFTHGGGWVFRDEIPDLDFFGKIVLKDNIYIGSGAYILPGVTIESNVIIAARSVVTKSVPSGVIVAGNPAKIVGTLDDFKSKIIRYNMGTKGLDEKRKIEVILNASQDKFISKDYMK